MRSHSEYEFRFIKVSKSFLFLGSKSFKNGFNLYVFAKPWKICLPEPRIERKSLDANLSREWLE